jgi:predicted Rossmann-fold nucleotide-binding protein
MTWAQLGIHHRACALWNVGGYYDLLLRFLGHAVDEKFMKTADRDLLLVGADLPELLDKILKFRPQLRQMPTKLAT